MRSILCALLPSVFLFVGSPAWSAEKTVPTDSPLPAKLEHPGDVALVEESDGYAYVHALTHVRLYVSDRDPLGKSSCDESCSFAWPPLVAAADAKPLGDWSIIKRDDGRRQWAYKRHPVYLLYHDSPSVPVGNGADGIWHFLLP